MKYHSVGDYPSDKLLRIALTESDWEQLGRDKEETKLTKDDVLKTLLQLSHYFGQDFPYEARGMYAGNKDTQNFLQACDTLCSVALSLLESSPNIDEVYIGNQIYNIVKQLELEKSK